MNLLIGVMSDVFLLFGRLEGGGDVGVEGDSVSVGVVFLFGEKTRRFPELLRFFDLIDLDINLALGIHMCL